MRQYHKVDTFATSFFTVCGEVLIDRLILAQLAIDITLQLFFALMNSKY